MIHILCTLVAGADHHLLIIFQILLGHTLYGTTHGSREHQRAMLGRQRVEYLVDSIRKAHVQHLVSFIKHNIIDAFQLGITTVFQVDETTRRSHDDLGAFLQRTNL